MIEVWSPEQKVKVTEFHVSKNGSLLRSAGVCLDDGLPRRRDTVKLFTAFLQPNGKINHFYIPFHTLSISSTAEKDIQTEARIHELAAGKPDRFLEELVKLVEDIRNIQLRNSTISQLLRTEGQLSASQSLELVQRLLESSLQADRSQSLDQKLHINRLTKLKQLISLYSCSVDILKENVAEEEDVSVETLQSAIKASESDLEIITERVRLESNKDMQETLEMYCSDFIQCFDIEGELKSSEIATVHLRKEIPPRMQVQLVKLFCGVISTQDKARAKIAESGVSGGEILELLLSTFLHSPDYRIHSLLSLHQSFILLLSLREGGDDRTVSSLQDIAKKILLKANITSDVYTLVLLWMNALKNVKSPDFYLVEWTRRLEQVSRFISILSTFKGLVKGEVSSKYTLSDVFDCGNGRIAEIVCKWLLKLNSNSLNLPANIEGFKESVELSLVSACADYFPGSMNCDILVVHLCWEELQRWQRNRNDLQELETSVLGLSAISCPGLRLRFLNLIWRSFFSKLFRDIFKRTDDFRKSSMNETLICDKEFGLRRENIAALMEILLQLLDKTLDMVKLGDSADIQCDYDKLSLNNQLHLLDHVKSTSLPDLDILSLEHQAAAVLYLTWKLRLPSRPLKLFNTVEINNLLSVQSAGVVSWFTDYNTSVKKERLSWLELVADTNTGHIYRLPADHQLDTEDYRKLCDILLQVGRVWFMSEEVRLLQCTALYKAGFDALGGDVRNTATEKDKLAENLLEIVILRIAKYLYQVKIFWKVN